MNCWLVKVVSCDIQTHWLSHMYRAHGTVNTWQYSDLHLHLTNLSNSTNIELTCSSAQCKFTYIIKLTWLNLLQGQCRINLPWRSVHHFGEASHSEEMGSTQAFSVGLGGAWPPNAFWCISVQTFRIFAVANCSLCGSRSPNHHSIFGGDKVIDVPSMQTLDYTYTILLSVIPNWTRIHKEKNVKQQLQCWLSVSKYMSMTHVFANVVGLQILPLLWGLMCACILCTLGNPALYEVIH